MILNWFSSKTWIIIVLIAIFCMWWFFSNADDSQFVGLNPLYGTSSHPSVPKEKPVNVRVDIDSAEIIGSILIDDYEKVDVRLKPVIYKGESSSEEESSEEEEEEILTPNFEQSSKTKSIGEHLTCEAFRILLNNAKITNNFRPKFLTNPKTGRAMEIDCWSEEYKIGVEYNGLQHYQYPTCFGISEEKFEDGLERDLCKRRLADENGTPIFTIPCTVDSYKMNKSNTKYTYVKRSHEERYKLIYSYLEKQLEYYFDSSDEESSIAGDQE
jgi:hypothetical protein